MPDTDNDGVCDEDEIEGCAQPSACNFDPYATDDDGSCFFPGDPCNDGVELTVDDEIQQWQLLVSNLSSENCHDPEATGNFSTEGIAGAECEYAEFYLDCDGQCLNDFDSDGVCDELEIWSVVPIKRRATMMNLRATTTVLASMPWKDVKLAQGNLMGLGLWSGVTWMATGFVISTKL